MSSSNGATAPEQTNQAAQAQVEKGKGKAANAEEPVEQSMDEDSDEDEEVSLIFPAPPILYAWHHLY